MTLQLIGQGKTPTYICLSTDIDETTLAGASIIGGTVLASDTANWYIVTAANTIATYTLPVDINVENVTIDAAIAIDQTTDGTTNAVSVKTSLGAGATIGTSSDAAVVTDAVGTLSSKLRGLVKWAYERMPASLGQKEKAASLPVTLASDEDVLGVSSTQLPAALAAGGGIKVEGVAGGVAVPVSGTVTASGPLTDTQLRATSVPIAIDQTTDGTTNAVILKASAGAGAGIGLTEDAAVTTDTTGSISGKMRGLVKWVAERMPAALGQASMADSLPVVIAGNQSDLVVVPHGLSDEIIVTPTLTVAATYVSGDYVGTSTTPMTFANCARINGGTGLVLGAMLVDSNIASVAGELWLFDDTITAPTDSAAWAISGADTLKCIGIIPFSTYYTGGSASVTFSEVQHIIFKTESDSRDLYGCFVTRGAPTYANGSLTFKLRIWQD